MTKSEPKGSQRAPFFTGPFDRRVRTANGMPKAERYGDHTMWRRTQREEAKGRPERIETGVTGSPPSKVDQLTGGFR